MRRVAQDLGVAPMTLYTYVPAKAELLDLMLDAAYLAMPHVDTSGRPWRERLQAVAEENRALFLAHPWAATVATHRPSLGPGQMAKYEHELHAFDDLGVSDVDRDAALAHLLAFVRAHARAAEDAHATRRESAMDDQQWWRVNEPLLRRVFDPTAYPLAVRVGTAAGAAHHRAWDPTTPGPSGSTGPSTVSPASSTNADAARGVVSPLSAGRIRSRRAARRDGRCRCGSSLRSRPRAEQTPAPGPRRCGGGRR